MSPKALAIFAVVTATAWAPVTAFAQATSTPSTNQKAPALSTASGSTAALPPEASGQSPKSDTGVDAGEFRAPRITVANPPPAPAQWPLHERIAWAANIVLAIVGYVGVMMARSLLKKIDRQTVYAEAAAEAAASTAHAALLHAQAIVQAERPWILITAEPAGNIENSFVVMATNRGRTPARIVATVDELRIAIDEAHLPLTPEYKNERPSTPLVPIILLPGESAAIKPFCRADLKEVCETEERIRRVENWEEKVFLFGKVIYRDLIAPPEKQTHETNWCCWYIHGRQKSGLVIAGPPEYNLHT